MVSIFKFLFLTSDCVCLAFLFEEGVAKVGEILKGGVDREQGDQCPLAHESLHGDPALLRVFHSLLCQSVPRLPRARAEQLLQFLWSQRSVAVFVVFHEKGAQEVLAPQRKFRRSSRSDADSKNNIGNLLWCSATVKWKTYWGKRKSSPSSSASS